MRAFNAGFQSTYSNVNNPCHNIYSGNHHTWNNNFLVLLLTTFEFISITISSNANLTTTTIFQYILKVKNTSRDYLLLYLL